MYVYPIEESLQRIIWDVENDQAQNLVTRCNDLQVKINELLSQEDLPVLRVQRLIEVNEILSNLKVVDQVRLPYQMPNLHVQPRQQDAEFDDADDIVNNNENGSDNVVTVDVIRETFYCIIHQALESIHGMGLISKEDIQTFDGFVMEGLPALALYTVVDISQGFNGICLVRDKIVNMNNCPNEFKQLLPQLLQIKEGVRVLTDKKANRNAEENKRVIKIKCIDNPELDLETNTPDKGEIMKLVSLIKALAGIVIQRETFRQNAKNAFEVYPAFVDQ